MCTNADYGILDSMDTVKQRRSAPSGKSFTAKNSTSKWKHFSKNCRLESQYMQRKTSVYKNGKNLMDNAFKGCQLLAFISCKITLYESTTVKFATQDLQMPWLKSGCFFRFLHACQLICWRAYFEIVLYGSIQGNIKTFCWRKKSEGKPI